MDNQQFIEIKRIVSDENKMNSASVQPESIDISLIESFRGWHKGKNDHGISGEMTLLVLKDKEKKESSFEKVWEIGKPKVRTILIEESYSMFLDRMSARVVVRRLE